MEKILVSACFLGEKVRYNSKVKTLSHPLLELWQRQGRLIAVCPEVAGGLSVPRKPAEIKSHGARVINSEGIDVSDEFILGANYSLALCQKYAIRFALLKEASPSCGSKTIYDGTFSNKKILGQGLTSKLLRLNGIQVFSEHRLRQLAAKLND